MPDDMDRAAEVRRMKDRANKVRARTRREMKELLHRIDSVLASHERAGPTKTRAGRRAVGKDGRSAQHILADAVHYIREIKGRAHTCNSAAAPQWASDAGRPLENSMVHPPPLLQGDCSQWQTMAVDDETVRRGLLSSHTLACFHVEMPGWTLLDLSPGAKRVLGQSPIADYKGQELINGFVHWEDVSRLERMWQSALMSGASVSSRVRILHGSIKENGPRNQNADSGVDHCGHGWDACESSGREDECTLVVSSGECEGFKGEDGILPSSPTAFACDPLLDETGAFWREEFGPEEGSHDDSMEDFFAESCVLPEGEDLTDNMGWCGEYERGCDTPPGASQRGVGCRFRGGTLEETKPGGKVEDGEGVPEPRQPRRPCVFQHQFVSLEAQLLCWHQRGEARKLQAVLLAPLDTASSWTVGSDKDKHAVDGSEGNLAGGAPPGAAWAASLGAGCADKQWEESAWVKERGVAKEEDEQKLGATMAAVSGVYKLAWNPDAPTNLTPGDVRQFISDLVTFLVPALRKTVDAAPPDILASAGMPAGDSGAISSLFQTVLNVTGAMSNWTVKTAVNLLFQYAESHVRISDDGGVPSVTLHMRASFFGMYSTPWKKVSHLRLDGQSSEMMTADGVLKTVSTLVKSRPGSISLSSFWVARIPYRDILRTREAVSRERQRVLPDEGSRPRAGAWAPPPARAQHGVPIRALGAHRGYGSASLENWEQPDASAGGLAFAVDEASGCQASDACGCSAPVALDAARWYVWHTRTFYLDIPAQKMEVHGFLPGKGEYSFLLNKIGPAVDAMPA